MEATAKKYSFFQAPVLSFFSKDLYEDVVERWKGCGALYLFLLVTLAWLIASVCLAIPMLVGASNPDADMFLQQVPHIKIADGKLTINKDYPFAIKAKTGETVALFVKEKKELTDVDPPIVVTQDGVLMKNQRNGQEQVMTFDKLASTPLEFDGTDIKGIIKVFTYGVPAVMFLCLPFVYLGHVVQILLYGLVAKAIAAMQQKELNFDVAMRVAAIAVSPAIVCSTLVWVLFATHVLAGPPGAPYAFVSIVMTLGFLAFAVSKGVRGSDLAAPAN